VRFVNSQVMTFLHVTCYGVVLHPRSEARMHRPPNYTVRTAKTTGMLQWIALILWMFFESTVDRYTHLNTVLDHVH
jgi:hypothetical protein